MSFSAGTLGDMLFVLARPQTRNLSSAGLLSIGYFGAAVSLLNYAGSFFFLRSGIRTKPISTIVLCLTPCPRLTVRNRILMRTN